MERINWEQQGGDVVIPTTQGIAVYENPNGDVVVRQQGYNGEDDSVIVIPRNYAKHVADCIVAQAMVTAESRAESVALINR